MTVPSFLYDTKLVFVGGRANHLLKQRLRTKSGVTGAGTVHGVLVVDDHEVVRRGAVSLLLARPDGLVCGEATNGEDAVERAQSLHPDVIIMDVSTPRLNGIEATRIIHNVLPESEVLVLSQHDAPEMARQAFKPGARGYVIKSSVGKNLTDSYARIFSTSWGCVEGWGRRAGLISRFSPVFERKAPVGELICTIICSRNR